MNNNSITDEKTLELLKELTIQDFLNVGLDQVAYIKCAEGDVFSVHAADGSQISIMNSYDTAVAAIRVNDLFPVTVH
jgi:hypothetical protein